MLLVRGNEMHGPRVEVEFESLNGPEFIVRDRRFTLHLCLNCGCPALDIERHADWHYGIAAGRPWGAGAPPGFRS